MKEARATVEMAKLLKDFLPGSGAPGWTGHVTFKSVAAVAGVGSFWIEGSKMTALRRLFQTTLGRRPECFEPLILGIVREGLQYRDAHGGRVTLAEIETLSGLVGEVGFRFPSLVDGS